MVTQSDIEMGHTKVSGTGVVTQSGIEMGHTKVSSGHSDGTHQGQWWSLRVE